LVYSNKLFSCFHHVPIKAARFREYLQAGYYGDSSTLLRLFDILWPYVRKTEKQTNVKAKQPAKELVWEQLYGTKPYDDAQLRRLNAALLKAIYQFLYLENLMTDELQRDISLLPHFKRPELEKHYQGLRRRIERELLRVERRDVQYHWQQHLQQEEFRYKQRSPQHIARADYHLDALYFLQKLKQHCDALTYQQFFGIEVDTLLNNALLKELPHLAVFTEKAIEAYYLVVRMLQHPDEEEAFWQLRTLLARHSEQLQAAELKALYFHLCNYCIAHRINVGASQFFKVLFELYQLMLEQGQMLEDGQLDLQFYKNVITVGLQVNEDAWVEHFIREYTELLPADSQLNARNYNLAKVYFKQRAYHKVIEQLREVEYSSHVYALGSKLMLIKTYYELDEDLALDSLIDSFRIYLMRNQVISREVRQQYLNVLRFVRQLFRLSPKEAEKMQRLQKQIENCRELADKAWIMEKLQEVQQLYR